MFVLREIFDDAREGLRSLLREQGFAGFVGGLLVICLTLNLTIFGLVYVTMIRELPFDDADRFAYIGNQQTESGAQPLISLPEFQARRVADVFVDAAVMSVATTAVERQGRLHFNYVYEASEGLFDLYKDYMELGRALNPADYAEGREVALLSFHYWHQYYGGDPAVLGQSVKIDGIAHEIVGVTRAQGFDLPGIVRPLPLRDLEANLAGDYRYVMIALLAEGVTLEEAQAAMARVDEALYVNAGHLRPSPDWQTRVYSYHAFNRRAVGGAVILMQVLTGLLLVVGLLNVAGLFLGRLHARLREFALRHVAGAGLARINRVLAFEVLFLMFGALVVATGLVQWTFSGMEWLAYRYAGLVMELEIDLSSMLTFWAVTTAMGLIAGAVAILHLQRLNLNGVIRERGYTHTAGRTTLRWQLALMGFQFACTVAILVVAANLAKNYADLTSQNLGVDWTTAEQVRIRGTDLEALAASERAAQLVAFRTTIADAVGGPVGVASAPFLDEAFSPLLVMSADDANSVSQVLAAGIDEHILPVLGIELVAGRNFLAEDQRLESPRRTIISARFARSHFGSIDAAIGQTFVLPQPTLEIAAGEVTVIGVVADHATFLPLVTEELPPPIYLPLGHLAAQEWAVVSAQAVGGIGLDGHVAAVLTTMLPESRTSEAQQLAWLRQRALGPASIPIWATAMVGGLGAIFAGVGMRAALSRYLRLFAREFAVRLSLGATTGRAMMRVVRMIGLVVLAGSAGGAGLVWSARWLPQEYQFGLGTVDFGLVVLVAGLIAVVTAAVSIGPLWRLARQPIARLLLHET